MSDRTASSRRFAGGSSRAALILTALVLGASAGGCWLLAAEMAPMGLHAMEAMTVATGDSITGRDPMDDEEKDTAKCDQLETAIPYVAEMRTNADGGIELRQWGLSAASGRSRWTIVWGGNAAADGWRPEQDLAGLEFDPPLHNVLARGRARYLIFAPAEASDAAENEQLISFIGAFGPADGEFRWHGREYKYAVAKDLPCFARAS